MNIQQGEQFARRMTDAYGFFMGALVGYMTSKAILESGGHPKTAMCINLTVFPMVMAGNFRPVIKSFFSGFAAGSIYASFTIHPAQVIDDDSQELDQKVYLRRK